MSDYDDDYGSDDYDDYDDYDDGGYDDGWYDYDSSDNEGSDSSDSEGDDDYGAHESEGHDAGEAVVEMEEGTIGFAVFAEVEDGHHDHGSTLDGGGHVEYNGFFDYVSSDEDNQGSTVGCGGREECNGFFDYAHSEDGYQSDDDNQVPCYGVVSPGPSYVRDRGDHPALYSPSPYARSARSGVQNYPSSHGNYHGPGTWYYERDPRSYGGGYYDLAAGQAYRHSYQSHYPPSNATASHPSGQHGGRHMSDFEYLQAWGGRYNFMTSYGLKPEPSGYEESQAIMNALRARQSQGYGASNSYAASATGAVQSPSPAHNQAAPSGANGYPYYQHSQAYSSGWWS